MDPFTQFIHLLNELDEYARKRFGQRAGDAVKKATEELEETDGLAVIAEVQYAIERNQSADTLEDMLDEYEGY